MNNAPARRRRTNGGRLRGLSLRIKVFFLFCVAVAGIYGGLTASLKILPVQTAPAALALLALWLGW